MGDGVGGWVTGQEDGRWGGRMGDEGQVVCEAARKRCDTKDVLNWDGGAIEVTIGIFVLYEHHTLQQQPSK